MSVKCVAFTIVVLHQSMSEHKVIGRNPLWNMYLMTFIILWILLWYEGEQQELSNHGIVTLSTACQKLT
jgi:hypothetical protein